MLVKSVPDVKKRFCLRSARSFDNGSCLKQHGRSLSNKRKNNNEKRLKCFWQATRERAKTI